jgi:CYTH domain-containing protein
MDNAYLQEKERVEQKPITVYWWNLGHKELEYQGSYDGYLKKKDIKVRIRKDDGYSVTIKTSSSKVVFTSVDCNYLNVLDETIRIFLTMMGDKATLTTPRFNYKINWRD